jgi:hypothetical protein
LLVALLGTTVFAQQLGMFHRVAWWVLLLLVIVRKSGGRIRVTVGCVTDV